MVCRRRPKSKHHFCPTNRAMRSEKRGSTFVCQSPLWRALGPALVGRGALCRHCGRRADYPVPQAYRYRNYVIDAFNADKPYKECVNRLREIYWRKQLRNRYEELITATGCLGRDEAVWLQPPWRRAFNAGRHARYGGSLGFGAVDWLKRGATTISSIPSRRPTTTRCTESLPVRFIRFQEALKRPRVRSILCRCCRRTKPLRCKRRTKPNCPHFCRDQPAQNRCNKPDPACRTRGSCGHAFESHPLDAPHSPWTSDGTVTVRTDAQSPYQTPLPPAKRGVRFSNDAANNGILYGLPRSAGDAQSCT